MRSVAAASLLALAAAGCAGAALDSATGEDTEAAYRAFLARHPEGPEASEAREHLESLAFRRAREADDIASYNRFLSEYSEGDFAAEARERRAWARLRRALDQGGADALRAVAVSDEGTPAGARARERLRDLDAAEAEGSDAPAVLRAYLLTYPEGEARRRVERRLDDVEFARARDSGTTSALGSYLESHPRGIHRAEAQDLVEQLLADDAVASGRVAAMEAFLREHPGARGEREVSRALARILVARTRVTLDPELARRALALDPEGPSAAEAEGLLEGLRRGGRRVERLRALVAELTSPLPVRSAEELRAALDGHDPSEGWNAIREAALSSELEALDVAVDAAGRGGALLLLYARAALVAGLGRFGVGGERHLRQWVDRLRPRSSNPEDLLRLAAVSEALGDGEAALRAYRASAGSRQTAEAAAPHWALIAAREGTAEERRLAAERVVAVSRSRLEELLDLVPERVDEEGLDQAILIRRRMGALERVLGTVERRLVAAGIEDSEESPPVEDLRRSQQALAAAGRRLEGRIRLVDEDALGGETDALAVLAAAHVRRRVEAAETLGRMRALEAVPALLEVASAGEGEVGRAALRAVASIPSSRARQGLLSMAQGAGASGPELSSALRAAAGRAPLAERAPLLEAAAALEGRDEDR